MTMEVTNNEVQPSGENGTIVKKIQKKHNKSGRRQCYDNELMNGGSAFIRNLTFVHVFVCLFHHETFMMLYLSMICYEFRCLQTLA